MSRTPLYLALLGLCAPCAHAVDAAPDVADASTLEAISVVGERETRQVQIVRAEQIEKALPGTNPLKVLEKLPGVHFVASDPYGTYEWSNRISIRGFNQNQLGYTLDGIPLGDDNYAPANGLSPNRAIVAENIADLTLAQGAGALSTASTSNLGGTIALRSVDPSPVAGARVDLAVGSYGTARTFVRGDTGEAGGFSAYLAGMAATTDKWKGDGPQTQRQFNAKLRYAWDGGELSAYANVTRRRETDYQDLSLDLIRRCGYDWDNYQPDWQRALDAANGVFHGCATGKDDAYYAASGLRDDNLYTLKGSWYLNDALSLDASAYYHGNEGQGHWFTPYIASPTLPIAMRITRYGLDRRGALASLNYTAGDHTLEFGAWFEDARHSGGRSWIDLSGPADVLDFYHDYAGTLFLQGFQTYTRQWHVQDTWTLGDALKINAGFKGQNIRTDATALVPGRAAGALTTKDAFLPQIGATWRLAAHADVFASYTENQAAFRPGVNGTWSVTQAQFDTFKDTLQPERSRTLEAGLRYGTDTVQASAAVYHVQFDNRQLVIAPCPGVVSCPNQVADVGRVVTDGVELALLWKPDDRLSWLNTLTYNDAQYRSNYLNGGLVEVQGKQVVDTPKQLFASEAEYAFGSGLSARLGAKYTGKRFYTYTNDAGVPGFWLWDAGLAWERGDLGWAKRLRVALTVTNLADKAYIATIGSNGFKDRDAAGTFATLLSGASRMGFLSADVQF